MMIELRPYQIAAVDAVFEYFSKHDGNPIVVLPTGSGKSLVLAELCRRAIYEYPETRILIATHRAELIQQDADAIRRLWPSADVGVYSAGLFSRQIRPITVGGVQSLVGVNGLPHFDLLFVDEAHLIPHDGEGHYRTLIAKLKEKNPQLKMVGVTATPYRLNGGRLTRGKNKIFSSICYELPIKQLVDEGYLSPLVTPANGVAFSTIGVSTRGGDWAPRELANKIEGQSAITRVAITEAAAIAKDRKSWLVFCVSIAHAQQAAQELFTLGVNAFVLTGETDMSTRKRMIDAFKRGEIRALVSCDVLTVGFDAPNVDCIVILRPTQSTGLYVQICGRGMRLSPGKYDCVVLDYGSNVERHGPITAVKPKAAKSDVLPVNEKACPRCDAEIPSWRRECSECGFIFPVVPREIGHDKTATRLDIMGPPPEPEWVEVVQTTFEAWRKKMPDDQPAPPTVRVRYLTGNLAKRDYSEWVCPEHGGFAQTKFHKWWATMGGMKPCPGSVSEALDRTDELREVEAIVVEKDGKYDRIKQHRLRSPREPGSDDDAGDEETQYSEPPMLNDDSMLPF